MTIKIKYILMMLTAMIFTACVTDEGNSLDEGVRRVSFRIEMDEAEMRSRASWGNEYTPYTAEDGTAFDKYIMPDALRIAILDANSNNMIGEVTNILHWKEADGTYRVLGEITDLNLVADNEYKVLVLANSGSATIQDGMTYSINDLTTSIPMWGVVRTSFTMESNQDLGNISLLRSAAKVEVVLAANLVAEGYSLNGVGLKNYRDAGYVYPYGWATANVTTDIDQDNCRIDAGAIVSSAKAMNIEGNTAVLYLPEYGNAIHKDTNPTSITVTVDKKEGSITETKLFEDAINFCQYDATGKPIEGAEYNIVRNHIYRFVITGISSGGIEVIYMVADWEDEDEYEPANYAYPTYHNPVVPDSYNRDIHDENYTGFSTPTMKYNSVNNEADAFSCWFKISAPVGQKWTPTLYQSAGDYNIKVYREETDKTLTEVSGSDLVADSERWYNIKIYPTSQIDTEKVVKFGITYDMNWYVGGGYQFLFINGGDENIAWPNSGTDPKIIEITHLVN